MNKAVALGLAGALSLAGCQKAAESDGKGYGFYAAATRGEAPAAASAEAPERRFIAVSHKLLIETSEEALPKAWEAAAGLCRSLRCEILSSSISNRTEDSAPSASLALRVAPEDLQKLLDQLGKAGAVVEHATESEDKTGTVIDVEARLKNMTELRNRLRAMLASRAGSLKDVVEVERELARVQADLDSLAARRKALANETEKVSLRVEFRAPRSISGPRFSSPIARAWRGAASVLAESIAALITVAVAVVPWLLVGVPLLWACVKLWRRLRRKPAG
jgi:Domain of unknown function (DUF4349)